MFDYSITEIADVDFGQPIAEQIWRTKYQYKTASGDIDFSVHDTWRRVARGLAKLEDSARQEEVARGFFEAMKEFKLLPAGRILSGCGTARNVTLSNTFVMRTLPDSVSGIMDTVKEAALTMQMGGGIGFDFSTIRPKGALVRGLDCPAAGPLAAMDICDAVCKMLVTGMGRGAMMATLRCDHPDIEAFVEAKSAPERLRNFNMSVMITDDFMKAVETNGSWDLIWDGAVTRRLSARGLWQAIMRQTYAAAEPGVLFIDKINTENPLNYAEVLSATNSCAEQPLPPNGTCPLASINLARLVENPFEAGAELNLNELRRLAGVAVRMLDNVIDVSRYATPAQLCEAREKRRIGLGVTGVGDALVMTGARYGSQKAVELLDNWMRTIQNAAYLASAHLAKERGAFPLYDATKHLKQPACLRLDADVQHEIGKYGLRNGVLTTIAPTGTISMFAGNVSSGIEPMFATSYKRMVTGPDGTKSQEEVVDYAAWLYRQLHGPDAALSEAFVTALELHPSDHVRMQAAAQRWVDSGISKTVNCPEDIAFEKFEDVYLEAYRSGCKGCTTYRPNAVTGSILAA
ncbi:adenosylcobalamin-dependent ribonucleoside-diphosphate reductase [Roseobacter sp. EG26]|uniref:adenosylcobalamin-dependent ribonucleoside-diphosphate reductase n=1 Tax=Roseobacter sp. EG26 TaxID=3412477 RepID=UPI003CE5B0EA